MPTFEFTDPNGKVHSITGPEGATKEQAFQMLQQHLGAAPVSQGGIGNTLAQIPAGIAEGIAHAPTGLAELASRVAEPAGRLAVKLGLSSPEVEARGADQREQLKALIASNPNSLPALQKQLSDALPAPQSDVARYVRAGSSAVPAMVGGTTGSLPAAIAGGVGGGVASQAAQDAGMGTAGQLLAGTAGALAAHGATPYVGQAAQATGRVAAQVPKATLQVLTDKPTSLGIGELLAHQVGIPPGLITAAKVAARVRSNMMEDRAAALVKQAAPEEAAAAPSGVAPSPSLPGVGVPAGPWGAGPNTALDAARANAAALPDLRALAATRGLAQPPAGFAQDLLGATKAVNKASALQNKQLGGLADIAEAQGKLPPWQTPGMPQELPRAPWQTPGMPQQMPPWQTPGMPKDVTPNFAAMPMGQPPMPLAQPKQALADLASTRINATQSVKEGAGVDAITGATDVDRSIPRIEMINGKPVDVHAALDTHEQTELPLFKALTAAGVPAKKAMDIAHAQATAAEKAQVEAQSPGAWDQYTKKMNGHLAHTEQGESTAPVDAQQEAAAAGAPTQITVNPAQGGYAAPQGNGQPNPVAATKAINKLNGKTVVTAQSGEKTTLDPYAGMDIPDFLKRAQPLASNGAAAEAKGNAMAVTSPTMNSRQDIGAPSIRTMGNVRKPQEAEAAPASRDNFNATHTETPSQDVIALKGINPQAPDVTNPANFGKHTAIDAGLFGKFDEAAQHIADAYENGPSFRGWKTSKEDFANRVLPGTLEAKQQSATRLSQILPGMQGQAEQLTGHFWQMGRNTAREWKQNAIAQFPAAKAQIEAAMPELLLRYWSGARPAHLKIR